MYRIAKFLISHPLTRSAKLSAFWRLFRWQIVSRLRQEVVVPWIGGTKLVVSRGMSGATGNIYVGLHEFADMMFLLHFVRRGDLFLDVGANVGTYTILASGVCGARTEAFEPDPDTAAKLQKNVQANGLAEIVRINQVVAGPEEATVRFTVGQDAVNQVAGPDATNVRLVPQKRLDAIVEARSPTMMKVDVEGYEENVLQGAERILSAPTLVAIELETVTEGAERILERHGFARMYYDPFTRALADTPLELRSSNVLFVRNADFVRRRVAEAPKVRVLHHLI